MRVLVAGGAGFLGSHLCARLHADGHTVVCVDNLATGNTANITSLIGHERFLFIEHDIREPLDITGPIDRIYNLACPASPVQYDRLAMETFETSVLGTRFLLELAHAKGARLLQASTSEIYGDPVEHPQRETYWGNVNTVGPRSCYDEGKRAAETLLYLYRTIKGVDTRTIRIFNTYGPNMDSEDGRVVSNFIMRALANKPLEVYGDGNQTRSLCYVDDLVAGIVLVMEGTYYDPVNLGNPQELTVKELAEEIIALTKSSSVITHHQLPRDDPKQRCPDITLARSFGWSPHVSRRDGLLKTIAYFRSLHTH